jgi:hypothetical protein
MEDTGSNADRLIADIAADNLAAPNVENGTVPFSTSLTAKWAKIYPPSKPA